jgi:hypothetical protein
MAFGMLLPFLLSALGLPPPGREHGPLGILRYFAYLQLTDWRRLLYVAVPAGFVPLAIMFLWKRLDGVGRMLVLVTAGYFLFFFVLAHVSLHHFVPAMVLPVAIAARYLGSAEGHRPVQWAWLAGATAGLVLSLPASFALEDRRREVAAAISQTVGDYARSDPAVLRASSLLHALFPYDWEASVPDSSYGGSPLAWNRYARHGLTTDSTNYLLAPAGAPAPAGMRLLASDSGAALYVRSDSVWKAHRALRPPTPAGSPVYAIHRAVLFHRPGQPSEGPYIIDTAALLAKLGLDVEPLLKKLGVRK